MGRGSGTTKERWMDTVKIKVSGRSLILKSDRSVDPLDPEVKKLRELTSKRKKTDEDMHAIARQEWDLALYWSEANGVFVPAWNLQRSILEGGRMNRLGAAIDRAVQILEDELPLKYSGPKTKDELWAKGYVHKCSVGIGDKRTMRYRPHFRNWSLTTTVHYEPSVIDREALLLAAQNAGAFIGLGDYRPRFGRYEVEVLS